MRFSAPTALEIRKVHQHGAARSRFVPPSGFLSLLTVYSLPNPPALFHAGNAHGVFPSEHCTPDSATLLSKELPSCGCSGLRSEDRGLLPPLQGFEPSREPYRAGEPLGPPDDRNSPGLAALQGLSPRILGLGHPLTGFSTSSRLPKLSTVCVVLPEYVRMRSPFLSQRQPESSMRDDRPSWALPPHGLHAPHWTGLGFSTRDPLRPVRVAVPTLRAPHRTSRSGRTVRRAVRMDSQ